MKLGQTLTLGAMLTASGGAYAYELPEEQIACVENLDDTDVYIPDKIVDQFVARSNQESQEALEAKHEALQNRRLALSAVMALLVIMIVLVDKYDLIARFKASGSLIEQIKELKKALKKATQDHKEEIQAKITEHEQELERLKKEHAQKCAELAAEIENWKGKHDDLVNIRTQELDGLRARIDVLNEEITRLKERRFDDLKRAADATVVTETIDSASEIIRMATALRDRMLVFAADKNLGEGEFFLLFSYNPDLSRIVASLRIRIDYILTQFCGSSNPDAAANASIVEPLVAALEKLDSQVEAGQFKEALKGAYKLLGQVEMLLQIAGTSGDINEHDDPVVAWNEYIVVKGLPMEWLNENNLLIDFFEVLGLKPVSVWSAEFSEKAKKAYRQKCLETHPDRNEGKEGEFKKVTQAYGVFSNQEDFTKYQAAYETYEKLFFNH